MSLKHTFELFKANLSVFGQVVHLDHLVDVAAEGHLFAPEALERILQIVLADEARVVHVELLEQLPQHLLRQRLLNLQSRRQELCVVYLTVAHVVDLADNFLDFAVRYADVHVSHGLCELVSIDKSTTILVYQLELLL